MKKTVLFICFLLITSIVIALPSCDMISNDNKNAFTDYSISKQTVYDENGIKVTVLGAAIDENGNPGLKIQAKNNTSRPVNICVTGFAINNISFIQSSYAGPNADMDAVLNPGKSAKDIICFDAQTLGEIGVTSLQSFSLYIFAYYSQSEEYEEYDEDDVQTVDFETKVVTVKTNLYGTDTQPLTLNGSVIYNENGVRLTVNHSGKKTANGVDDIYFALENISNELNVSANITDFEVYNEQNERIRLEYVPSADEPIILGEPNLNETLNSLDENLRSGISTGHVAVTSAPYMENAMLQSNLNDISKMRFRFTLSFTDPNAVSDSITETPSMSITNYELPYGEYAQTVEIDFSKKTVDTVWKYDPENIAHEEYTVDNGNGNIGETVIFDEQGLKITVLSMTDNKEGVGLRIENNSDDTVGIYFDDTVVNGIDINNEAWLYWNYGGDYGGDKYGFGLCDLSCIAPGDHIETKYTPARIETENDTNISASLGQYEFKKITGELQTLSFRLVIAYQESGDWFDTYHSSLRHRTAKTINITIDGESE